jgi:hypothetical protein
VIFVDDRLNDASAIVITAKALADKRRRLIKLSRNFGHRIAITAGPDHAAGRAARNHSTIERSAIRPASPMSRWMGERECDQPVYARSHCHGVRFALYPRDAPPGRAGSSMVRAGRS